jgi:hypothetical protein
MVVVLSLRIYTVVTDAVGYVGNNLFNTGVNVIKIKIWYCCDYKICVRVEGSC